MRFFVTIKEVQVCKRADSEVAESEWITVEGLEYQTFDLLNLINGAEAYLGTNDQLSSGTYNQMRLILGDINTMDPDDPELPPHYVLVNGTRQVLKIPSGYQTGIKLVHPFEIVEGRTTGLILDFDVAKSVVKAGNSGKYILKPTIKVIGTRNRATVSGLVTEDTGTEDDVTEDTGTEDDVTEDEEKIILSEAKVSVQTYNSSSYYRCRSDQHIHK